MIQDSRDQRFKEKPKKEEIFFFKLKGKDNVKSDRPEVLKIHSACLIFFTAKSKRPGQLGSHSFLASPAALSTSEKGLTAMGATITITLRYVLLYCFSYYLYLSQRLN